MPVAATAASYASSIDMTYVHSKLRAIPASMTHVSAIAAPVISFVFS